MLPGSCFPFQARAREKLTRSRDAQPGFTFRYLKADRDYLVSTQQLLYKGALLLAFAVMAAVSPAKLTANERDHMPSYLKQLYTLNKLSSIVYTCVALYCMALQRITIINTLYLAWMVILLLARTWRDGWLQAVWWSLTGFAAAVIVALYSVGLTSWARKSYAVDEVLWNDVSGFSSFDNPTNTFLGLAPSLLIYLAASLGCRSALAGDGNAGQGADDVESQRGVTFASAHTQPGGPSPKQEMPIATPMFYRQFTVIGTHIVGTAVTSYNVVRHMMVAVWVWACLRIELAIPIMVTIFGLTYRVSITTLGVSNLALLPAAQMLAPAHAHAHANAHAHAHVHAHAHAHAHARQVRA